MVSPKLPSPQHKSFWFLKLSDGQVTVSLLLLSAYAIHDTLSEQAYGNAFSLSVKELHCWVIAHHEK